VFAAFSAGFAVAFGLIAAIGAQNAFVLRQGLRGDHVLSLVVVCAGSDALLIALGVGFFGALSAALPDLLPVIRWAGALFLGAYALRSLWKAVAATERLEPAAESANGRRGALLTCLALTWLNPHVYLDTVVLLGGLSTQHGDRAAIFGLGAATASATFFLMLGFGARLLRPLFATPLAWRVLDGVVGATMAAIAWTLAAGA
jgi:L-lysine exporter family protein LysE/ArgO